MMRALPAYLHMTRTLGVALLLLASCDSRRSASTTPVAVVMAVPRATTTIGLTRATPTATPSPITMLPTLADMRPRKTFVDPPLPPELLDDGGLRPLPATPITPPTR